MQQNGNSSSPLSDRAWRNRRMNLYGLIIRSEREAYNGQIQDAIGSYIEHIRKSMTKDEEAALNAGYLAYKRMQGYEFQEGVKYNFVPQAIKWKILNEFSPTKTPDKDV